LPASSDSAPALSLFASSGRRGHVVALVPGLREERGLAYSIYAPGPRGFADTGLFAVNLAADKARATEALNLARAVVERVAEELTEAELNRARAQIEAAILMALETPQGRADAMARSIEIFGRIMTPEEMLGELRAVDVAAARSAGRQMLDGPRAIASIGGKLALAA
jgi:predicted Zn-dependent peptidase